VAEFRSRWLNFTPETPKGVGAKSAKNPCAPIFGTFGTPSSTCFQPEIEPDHYEADTGRLRPPTRYSTMYSDIALSDFAIPCGFCGSLAWREVALHAAHPHEQEYLVCARCHPIWGLEGSATLQRAAAEWSASEHTTETDSDRSSAGPLWRYDAVGQPHWESLAEAQAESRQAAGHPYSIISVRFHWAASRWATSRALGCWST
jgi:hypothetical protein